MKRALSAMVCVCWAATACVSSPRVAPAVSRLRSLPAPAATFSQPTAADSAPDLFVRCEDPSNCPEAVGMLVVDRRQNEEPGRCTVTLIRADRALTASHCLAPEDRRAGAQCARTWIVFPESTRAPRESLACLQVIEATEVISESALMQEHAVLQLARASARSPVAVDALPPEPGSIVTVASITPHPIYGTTHALSTRLCRVMDAAPAERALGAAAADVGWLTNCPIAHGNSGSPVIDYRGHLRAIVHGGTELSAGIGVTSLLPGR